MEKTDSTVERIGGYRIVRRLAIGGTSDVLLAKAEGPLGFERAVVLKRLLAQYKSDDDFTKMFAREAAAYARLSHPAIVRLFDFFATSASTADRTLPSGDAGDAQLVMVLEYVDGPPLHRLRGMLKAMGGGLDDVASIHVAAAIFDALAAAHAANDEAGTPAPVIHRDVNPTNVLIGWDGQVKLADFGVAKVTGVSHESRAGLVRGTYGYMAPEQVTGAPITPRADVYAAGIVLWEMLTKRRAFQRGALPEIEVMRAMAEPRLVTLDALRPDVDKAVREAVSRALVPNAQKRTITAEEMVAVLRAAVHPDKGRERLLAALGIVRHEPKISATSMPPPPPPGEADALHPSPKAMAPPRVPRATGAGGGAVQAPRPSGTQPVAGAAPKPSPYRQTMYAAVAPPVNAEPAPAMATQPPVVTTSAAPGASGSLAPVGLFDSLVVPPVKNAESPVLKLDEPFAELKPGPGLRDQIDDLLKDVPTTVPPHLFGERSSAQRTRELGQIPAAPPPLRTKSEQKLPAVIVADDPPAPPANESGAAKEELVATAKAPSVPPPLPSGRVTRPPPLPAPEPALVNPSDVISLSDAALRDSVPPFGPDRPTSIPPARARRRGPLILVLSGMFLCTASFAVVGAMKFMRARRAEARIAPPALATTTTTPTVSPFVATTASATPVVTASASASASAGTEGSTAAAGSAPSAAPSVTVAMAAPTVSADPAAPVAKDAPKDAKDAAKPAPQPQPQTPAPSSGTGIVKTEGAAPGRRIFIDERTMGQTPQPITVKCGTHMVKVGSSGRARSVDVPCGGEVIVSDR